MPSKFLVPYRNPLFTSKPYIPLYFSKIVLQSFRQKLSRDVYCGELFVELLRLAICTSTDKLQNDIQKVFIHFLPRDDQQTVDTSETVQAVVPPTTGI